jgi:hypothetical protein
MKKTAVLIVSIFMLAACQVTYDTASVYDDVYYTPGSSAVADAGNDSQPAGITYGSNTSVTQYEQSAVPQSEQIENDDYKSSYTYDESYPDTSSDEYYYLEDEDEGYYDYNYSARINRFHRSYVSFGYYDPFYTSMYYDPFYYGYGSRFSFGYGFGWPGSYFSMGYGWGYPSYYRSYYNPWSYGYGYPYGGYGSYWSGYYHGFHDGYWAGGGGGTYYPGEVFSDNYYYGPRNSRGSSIISSTARGTRITGDDDGTKSSRQMGRESRITDGSGATKATDATNRGRDSRTLEPQRGSAEITTGESREVRQDKIAKPASDQNLQGVKTEPSRTRSDVRSNTEATSTTARPGEAQTDRIRRSEQERQQYAKPQTSTEDRNVYSRDRRYAKPQANDLERTERTTKPRSYTAPNTNRPRSSNEYTVPNSRNTRSVVRPQPQTRPTPTTTPANTRRNYTAPSRSDNRFSTPSRSTTPTRTVTPRSTPTRSISTPQRSSGSISTPSRSSGSSSSGRSSSGSSSSSSSSGKRGR